MKIKNRQAFTLVELIVVITILAILSTIWFVSYSGYLAGSRDSNRISQLKAISEWLQLYSTNHSLPTPDAKSTNIMDNWTQIATQWYAWKNVLETITYSTEWVDPKDNIYYSYYLTKNKKYYQLMGWLEEEDNLQNQATWIDYSIRYPIVFWNKLWILTDKDNTPIQETWTTSIDISNIWIEIKSYLKDSEYVTGTWSRFSNLDEVDEKWGQHWYVVDNLFFYDNPNTGWRLVDPNCDINDITIGSQTWAWCNSTIWNWFERWKKDNGSDWVIDNTYSCFDYNINNDKSNCTIWNSLMASNANPKDYFDIKLPGWTNINWDIEFDTIWGKLYTWNNANTTACWDWYHLPTDEEWEYAEEYLFDWTEDLSGCRTWVGTDQCNTIWWKAHTTTNKIDNLVNILKIPLAGYRDSAGSIFYNRGYDTNFHTSTLNGSDVIDRFIYYNYSYIMKFIDWSKDTGCSVRCIKD